MAAAANLSSPTEEPERASQRAFAGSPPGAGHRTKRFRRERRGSPFPLSIYLFTCGGGGGESQLFDIQFLQLKRRPTIGQPSPLSIIAPFDHFSHKQTPVVQSRRSPPPLPLPPGPLRQDQVWTCKKHPTPWRLPLGLSFAAGGIVGPEEVCQCGAARPQVGAAVSVWLLLLPFKCHLSLSLWSGVGCFSLPPLF